MAHLAVIAVLLAAGGGSKSTPQKQADELIQKGNDLRRRGDNYGAFEFFRQAHELAPTPKTEAQLGLAEQSTGRWADAEGHLTTALRDTQDPWVKKNREILKQSLEDAHVHVGRVEIVGDPEKATVLVNGKAVGVLPLAAPVAVNAGNVDVEVSADGYTTERRSINAPAQQVQTLVIRLKKLELMPTAPVAQASEEGTSQQLAVQSEARASEPPPSSKKWLWIGIGAAVLVAAVAGVLIATRKDEYPTSSAQVSW